MNIMANYSEKQKRVFVSFWMRDDAMNSIDNNVWLSPEQARSLLAQLQKAVADIPRVACADDLGVAA